MEETLHLSVKLTFNGIIIIIIIVIVIIIITDMPFYD